MPDEGLTVAMTIILGAAEGEIVADPDVQRSALSVLINCVCAPIHRVCMLYKLGNTFHCIGVTTTIVSFMCA